MKNQNVQKIVNNIKNPKSKHFILAFIGSLQALFSVLFAFSVKDVINSAFYGGEVSELIKASVISVVFVIASFACMLTANILNEKFRIEAEVEIKKFVFKGYVYGSYKSSSKYMSGDVVNTLDKDSFGVANAYITVLPQVITLIFRLISIISALFILQPFFTLILIVIGAITVLATYFIRKITIRLYKTARDEEVKASAIIGETATNMLTVKGMRAELKLIDKLGLKLLNYAKARKNQRYFQSGFSSLTSFMFTAFYVVTLIVGAVGIFNGYDGFDYGVIVSMLQLVTQIKTPISSAGSLISSYYEMGVSADRLTALIGDKQTRITPVGEFKSLKVDNISFGYDGNEIVKQKTFSVKNGEKVVIKGATGVGKSTLLKLITGIYKPDNGEVLVEYSGGVYNVLDVSDTFSVAFQGNMLFGGTLKENLTFMRDDVTDEEIENAVRFACLDDVVKSVGGLDGMIGERGTTLSEGQAQRVAIARALLTNRPIMILDEPTSALDSNTQKVIINNIKMLDKTVIIVSHSNEIFGIADKIIEL